MYLKLRRFHDSRRVISALRFKDEESFRKKVGFSSKNLIDHWIVIEQGIKTSEMDLVGDGFKEYHNLTNIFSINAKGDILFLKADVVFLRNNIAYINENAKLPLRQMATPLSIEIEISIWAIAMTTP